METERILGHHVGRDGHHAFSEKIAGNSDRGHIPADCSRSSLPGRVTIMGDEHRDIFLVIEIEDRDEDMPGLQHIKFDFEINRFPDVESIFNAPVFGFDADRP